MPVASIVSKRTYIARESVVGTRQPPNLFLEGLNIRVVPNSTRGEVRPSGSTMRTARPLVQDWSTFSVADGSYVDYNSIIYPMAGLLGVPVITTPGGGTNSREHAFTYASDGLNTRPSFTFATGYRGGIAEETVRNVFQSFGFTFSRTAAPTISGSGYGRNADLGASLGVNEVNEIVITGGADTDTFTVTVNGQTTAAVDWDVIAADLQTALEALSNVVPGDVTVTGGPGGTAALVLTWGGNFANTNVTVTSTGTGCTATTTTTQQGGITTVPVKAVQAPEWDMYFDTAVGSIGTTRLRAYSGEFNFGGLVNPDWVIDSSVDSYDDDVLQVPDLSLNVVARNDATSRTIFANLLEGDTYYVRFKATGPIIEGAIPYLLQMDFAVQADENIGQFADQGGSETMPFPLTIVSDSTHAAGGFSALIRNVLTTL